VIFDAATEKARLLILRLVLEMRLVEKQMRQSDKHYAVTVTIHIPT